MINPPGSRLLKSKPKKACATLVRYTLVHIVVSLGKPPPVLLSTEVFSLQVVEIVSALVRNLRTDRTLGSFFFSFSCPSVIARVPYLIDA